MKFIQQEGHVLQPDTMMPPEVQLITDPEMWIVSIYLNKTVSFLCCPEQNEDEVQNAYIPPVNCSPPLTGLGVLVPTA